MLKHFSSNNYAEQANIQLVYQVTGWYAIRVMRDSGFHLGFAKGPLRFVQHIGTQ